MVDIEILSKKGDSEMKQFYKIFIAAIIFTVLLSGFSFNKTEAATSYKKGDIFVTSSTSKNGITGHTGIVIDSNTILHTSGWKSEPYPTTISISNWLKRYPKTKVSRPNSSTLGSKAADMAVKYFKGKKINYKITFNPKDIDPNTYCSELVWYSYYKAGKTYQIFGGTTPGNPTGYWKTPSIVEPYIFINSQTTNHNGFTRIDNKW